MLLVPRWGYHFHRSTIENFGSSSRLRYVEFCSCRPQFVSFSSSSSYRLLRCRYLPSARHSHRLHSKSKSQFLIIKKKLNLTSNVKLLSWNSACPEPNKVLSTISAADKTTIVDYHNELRRKVAKGLETRGAEGSQPGGANMRKIASRLCFID